MRNFGFILDQSQCSNNCVFCGSQKFGDINKNIERECKKLQKVIDSGIIIESVEISGNDPCEYNELPELIIRLRREYCIQKILLSTHGRAFIDTSFLERLIEAGVDHFILPFYGHIPLIHDSVTQVKGSFNGAFLGLVNLYRYKQKVSFQSLVLKENQAYIKQLLIFLTKFPAHEFIRLGIPCISTSKGSKHIPNFEDLKNHLDIAIMGVQILDKVHFVDVPQCIYGKYTLPIMLNEVPLSAYDNHSMRKETGSGELLARYRIRSKGVQCKNCNYDSQCIGIYRDYLEQKLFVPKPINKPST